jgi:hypothetical protein
MPDHHDRPPEPISASPALDRLLDERDDVLAEIRIHDEIIAVRADQPRADAQATALLGVTSGLLLAGLALLGAGKVHGPAAGFGWTAAGLLAGAVLLLSAAIKPRLGGGFGFVRGPG